MLGAVVLCCILHFRTFGDWPVHDNESARHLGVSCSKKGRLRVCVCVYVRWQEYAAMRLHLYASSGGVFVRFAQKLIFIYEFLRLEPVALGSVAAVRRLVL